MSLSAAFLPHTLRFKFRAGTSRGVLTEKTSWFLAIRDRKNPEIVGWGEAGPLPGLSPETGSDVQRSLEKLVDKIRLEVIPLSLEACLSLAAEMTDEQIPSLRFALETALLDLCSGGKREIFPTDFYNKKIPIPINGLIWMGEGEFMEQQFQAKLDEGYDCFKMKIGAIDFNSELQILRRMRETTGSIIRVDANGAFSSGNAMKKLQKLAQFNLHSIEQPLKAGNYDEMADLCRNSPVPVALDEELIGINSDTDRAWLLDKIQPRYIILKPTLLGGISATKKWVALAEERGIGWWMTSALESNIGLNAICQLTDSLNYQGHQGLGTGQLFSNNIPSPLVVHGGKLLYDANRSWKMPILK